MRKIISSIDIGGGFIKLVVGEFVDNRLYILSASKIETSGIDNGKIVDREAVIKTIKKSVAEVSDTLGIDIKKIILGINPINAKLVKSVGTLKTRRENKILTGDDIANVIQKCADNKVDEDYILIGVLPVEFTVDGNRRVKDPKGIESETLELKGIVVTSPKDYVKTLLNITEASGLKVVDIVPTCLGDYYSFKNKNSDSSVGVVINLGYNTTSISIFNKGILTNTKSYKMGSKNIINDIGFIYKLDDKTSGAVYKDIVRANPKLASPKEYRTVINLNDETVKLDQVELSEIAAVRIEEILNLAKKQINILTKKEISYIIISGGLTELKDFNLTLEGVFGKNVYIGTLNLIGARDNSFASAVGILKYFEKKVELRGKTFSIFTGSEINEMNNGGNKTSVKDNSLLSKVFGYFFDS